MAIIDDVANYVRKQGQESSSPVHTSQVADALGLTMNQVQTARSRATRAFDDIYPCSPGYIVYEPDWKTKHPEDWVQAQARSQKMADAIAQTRQKAIRPEPAQRKKSGLPNVVGPVIMIHNVQGVNVHPDHIAIQHTDGSWTQLNGTVTIAENGHV